MFNLLSEVFFFTRLQPEKRQSPFGFTSGNSVKLETDPVGQIRNFSKSQFLGYPGSKLEKSDISMNLTAISILQICRRPNVGAKCSSFPYLSLMEIRRTLQGSVYPTLAYLFIMEKSPSNEHNGHHHSGHNTIYNSKRNRTLSVGQSLALE